jgi:hypothetical protein
VGFAGVEAVLVDGDLGVVVVVMGVLSFVGVAVLESSSLSESESESQVRSSVVVCAAPVGTVVSNVVSYCSRDNEMETGVYIPLRTSLLLTSSS